MKNFNDVFKKEDEKLLNQAERDVKENVMVTGKLARICLESSAFKRYKDQYIKAEDNIVHAMLMLTVAYESGRFDLTTYATKTLVYMTKLKQLKLLLDTVTSDAKKGNSNAKEV